MSKLTTDQYTTARQMIDEEVIGALDQHKGKILDSWYDKLASVLQFNDPDAPISTGNIERCDVFNDLADLRMGVVPMPSGPRVRALIGDSMTVADLIGHLKTLPQDYIVKSGTVNDLADDDVKPGFVTANHERKVVVI